MREICSYNIFDLHKNIRVLNCIWFSQFHETLLMGLKKKFFFSLRLYSLFLFFYVLMPRIPVSQP